MAEPFTVACEHCHSKLKLKSTAAVGKKIACPKCKKPFVVRAPEQKNEDALFDDLPLDDYQPPESERSEEEEEPAPRASRGKVAVKGKKGSGSKKSRKSSDTDFGSILLIAALVLVGVGGLGGAGYAILQFLPAGGGSLTSYLPEDIDAVVHVRVADLVGSPVMAPLMGDPKFNDMIDQPLAAFGGIWPASIPEGERSLAKLLKEAGLQSGEIESVTVGAVGAVNGIQRSQAVAAGMVGGMAGVPMDRFVGVVKTKNPINLEQVKKGLKLQSTSANHNGQEYFTTPLWGKTMAYYRPEEKTLVFAPEADLKGAIDSRGAAPARSRFKFVDPVQHVILAFGPKDISLFRTKLGMESVSIDAGGTRTPSTDDIVSGMSSGLQLTSDIVVRQDVRYTSSSIAKNSVADHQKDIDEGKEKLEEMKRHLDVLVLTMPTMVPPVNRILENLSRSMGGATVSPSGTSLVTQMTISGVIVKDFKEVASLGIAMMGQPGAGGMGGFSLPGGSPNFPQAGVLPPGVSPGLPMGTENPGIPVGLPTGLPAPTVETAPTAAQPTIPVGPAAGLGAGVPMGPVQPPGAGGVPMGPVQPPGAAGVPVGPATVPGGAGGVPMGPVKPPGAGGVPVGPAVVPGGAEGVPMGPVRPPGAGGVPAGPAAVPGGAGGVPMGPVKPPAMP